MNILTEPLPGWRHLSLLQTASTNTIALERFQSGDPGNLWISAKSQTEGRGRRGRDWHSPTGNLYCSVLLVYPQKPPRLTLLPLVAALALHDAIATLAPSLEPSLVLKWPNDLLLNGAKISGILLEAAIRSAGEYGIVIGFGVNCAEAPPTGLYDTASLNSAVGLVDPEHLHALLIHSLYKRLAQWSQPKDAGAIRNAWLARAVGVGETIVARFPDNELTGRFIALDDHGFLVLESSDGERHNVSAADIFLGTSRQTGA